MNILLTSVGRRAYIVQYFKEAIKKNGGGTVHACNSDDLSSAFQYADQTVISPLIYSQDYIPFLLDYCTKNQIQLIISLFDIDLYVLSQNKELFDKHGITILVSDPDLIACCNDKWKTYQFLYNNHFSVPKTYQTIQDVKTALSNGELHYPIMVKPRFGCGSIGLQIADNEQDLTYMSYLVEKAISHSYIKYESASATEKIIYQELLTGQEYGIDIINDMNGKFQNAIIKKKLAMRSGETDIAETATNNIIYDTAKKLAETSQHIGNMDCDVFLQNNTPYILEMNARFGGGYPFSHIAGCNLPEAIIRWAHGKPVEKQLLEAQPGIRAYKEIMICKNDH